MEIIRNLSEQSFPAGSGRIALKNSLRHYLHLLKSPDFKLLVLNVLVLIRGFFLYSVRILPHEHE